MGIIKGRPDVTLKHQQRLHHDDIENLWSIVENDGKGLKSVIFIYNL